VVPLGLGVLKTARPGADGVGMRMASTRLRRVSRRVTGTDSQAGLTMIEVIVAMVIFAMVAGAVVTGLASAMKTARTDKNRVAAANLAARELEITRNEFNSGNGSPAALAAQNQVVDPHPLPGGTAGQPLRVDGVPYTVTRNVEWLPAGSGKSACDGGAAITYPTLSVHVEVTWPVMGNVPPVESTTMMTPAKGTLASTLAFVGVKVMNAAGGPQSDLPVTLTGPGGTYTDTTADDGCAVFSLATPGAYTASMSIPGYVDFYGTAAPTKAVTVTASTLSQVQINYDQAAALTVGLTTASGYALPTTLPGITLSNTGLQPSGIRTQASSGATTTINTLWPFTDGYSVWAGTCSQSDPATAGGTRSAAVVVGPGGTASTTASLAPVAVTVKNASGVVQPNMTLVAVPVSTTGCLSADASLTLGVTNSLGVLMTSLPAGKWTLQVSGKSPSGSWPVTPSLLPTSSPTSMTVVTT
jgi:prepilin-type N-terminal cleavage/methylation domain-containing protein